MKNIPTFYAKHTDIYVKQADILCTLKSDILCISSNKGFKTENGSDKDV